MKGFWLTEDQLKELRAAHRCERNKHAAYKINAVILLGQGWKLREVKEALLLDEETLRSYVDKFERGGVEELIKTHYAGSSAQLTAEQCEQLEKELERKIYLTAAAVAEYVRETFKVSYSESGMRDVLHRLDYEYKKPKVVPGNGDREAQEIFAEQFEAFMEAKGADVEVYFADAVHPQHNTHAAYGWMKKGARRLLPSNTGRERLNLHGAISAETHEMTVIEAETVDKHSTLQLLEVLKTKHPEARELVVILDNAPYHYAKEVREWVKDKGIRLVFLPTYSPQLNLIERVWKFFKKHVLYNQYYPTLKDFRAAAIAFFRTIGERQEELASLLDGGFEDIEYA